MKPESFFPEMNCQQCREECERLLDESLTEEQRSEIEARISAHLETCPDCASEFAFVQNLRLTLPQMQNLTVAPPTFLRANVRAALVEEFGTQRQSKPRFSIPLWTRSMWAGGLVVAFGFLLLSRQISPFSSDIPNETRSSDQIVQEAPSAARDAAPAARQERQFAKAQPTKKNGAPEILPEKTPVPAPKVFVAPSKPLVDDSPIIGLPEVKVAPIPSDSPKISAPKENAAPESGNKPKSSHLAPVPAPSASLTAPTPNIMRQMAPGQNRATGLAPAESRLSKREQALEARSAEALTAPADAMPAATIAPQAAQDSASANWQTGKITLALAPAKLKSAGGGVAAAANSADPRIDSLIGPPRPMAAKSFEPDRNTTNSAANNQNFGAGNSRIARGGGEKPQSVQGFAAPAPIAPGRNAPATSDVPAIKAPTLIPRKLILQSEFAIFGARLLQNDKPIWEGDLPANKPVEIEFMAPVNASEKNSFVLEQIGADGESNRKSLILGD